jgi:hypothetical protein
LPQKYVAAGESGDNTGIGVGDSDTGISVSIGAGAAVVSSIMVSPFPLSAVSPFPLELDEVVAPGFLFGGGFLPPEGLIKAEASSLKVGDFVGSSEFVALVSGLLVSGSYGS